MRILFVSSGNAAAGISPIVRAQARSLEREGVEVDLFPVRGNGVLGYLRSARDLRHYLSRTPVDIVHAHYGLCGMVSVLARPTVPTVVSFMGSDVLATRHGYPDVSMVEQLIAVVNKGMARYAYDHVIVKSHHMRQSIPRKKGIDVVPNGVDFDLFRPLPKSGARHRLGWDAEARIIIWVSDPNRPEKNFPLAKAAVDRLETPGATLHVVTGVPQRELPVYYSAADALLLTSRYEGSPNVVKEAMACNCPIVSTDVGDVRAVIKNTAGCYVVSASPEAVADGLKRALAFGQRTKGRAAIAGLDSRRIAAVIIQIYERVLKHSNRSRGCDSPQ